MSKISSILFLFSCFTVAGYLESIDRFAEIARKSDVREQISACREILSNPSRYETTSEIEKGSLTELILKTALPKLCDSADKMNSWMEPQKRENLIITIREEITAMASEEVGVSIRAVFSSGVALGGALGDSALQLSQLRRSDEKSNSLYSNLGYLLSEAKTCLEAGIVNGYKLVVVKCTPQVKQHSMNNSLLNFDNIGDKAVPLYNNGIVAYSDKLEIKTCLEEINMGGKERVKANKANGKEPNFEPAILLPAHPPRSMVANDKEQKLNVQPIPASVASSVRVDDIQKKESMSTEVKLAPQGASGDPLQSVEGGASLKQRLTPNIGSLHQVTSVVPHREVVRVPSNDTPSPKILSGELDASALGVANVESSMIGENSVAGATGLFSDSQLSLVSMMSIDSFCDIEILKIINVSNIEAGLMTKELLELRGWIENGKLREEILTHLSVLGITQKVGKIITILKVKLAISDETSLEDLIERLYIEEDSRYSPFVISFKFNYKAENIDTMCVLTDFANEMIKNAWQGYSGERFEAKQTNVATKEVVIYIGVNRLEEGKIYNFLDLLNAAPKFFAQDIAEYFLKLLFTLSTFVPDEFNKWVLSCGKLPPNEYTKPLCGLMEIVNSSFVLEVSHSRMHGKKRCIRWLKGGKECFYTGESGTVEVKGKIKKKDPKLEMLVKQVNLVMGNLKGNSIQQSSGSKSFSEKDDLQQQVAVPIPSDGRPPRAPAAPKKK